MTDWNPNWKPAETPHRFYWCREQPRVGQCMLYCEHIGNTKAWSFSRVIASGTVVKRPDGSQLHPEWLVECPDCLRSRQAGEPKITGDGYWGGGEPVIRVEPSIN